MIHVTTVVILRITMTHTELGHSGHHVIRHMTRVNTTEPDLNAGMYIMTTTMACQNEAEHDLCFR